MHDARHTNNTVHSSSHSKYKCSRLHTSRSKLSSHSQHSFFSFFLNCTDFYFASNPINCFVHNWTCKLYEHWNLEYIFKKNGKCRVCVWEHGTNSKFRFVCRVWVVLGNVSSPKYTIIWTIPFWILFRIRELTFDSFVSVYFHLRWHSNLISIIDSFVQLPLIDNCFLRLPSNKY